MTRMYRILAVCTLATLGLVLPLVAQDSDGNDKKADAKPASDEAKDQPSAEDVLNELLRRRSENPLIEPTTPSPTLTRPVAPDNAIQRIAGTAPKLPVGPVRPQGTLIISRRGRVIRASGGMTPWAFVFESDGPSLKDPPMFLMPCEELQKMEETLGKKGDTAVFEVSGEVYVYRGVNYLLPTRVMNSPDRGNLRP